MLRTYHIGVPLILIMTLAAVSGFLWLSDARAIDPPHMYEAAGDKISCDKCHTVNNAPGGSLINNSLNADLCIGCHTSSGIASALPFSDNMQGEPGVSGISHPWNATMPSASSSANPGGVRKTDDLSSEALKVMLNKFNDVVTCSVCHAQHIQSLKPWDAFSNSAYYNGITDDRHMMREDNQYNQLCEDCHYFRAMNYADAKDETTANGTTVFSHPVGEILNSQTYDYFSPLDATGVAQTNSPSGLLANRFAGDADDNPHNDLVLDVDKKVRCLTCHRIHYADSNSLTNAVDMK